MLLLPPGSQCLKQLEKLGDIPMHRVGELDQILKPIVLRQQELTPKYVVRLEQLPNVSRTRSLARASTMHATATVHTENDGLVNRNEIIQKARAQGRGGCKK
jgi:hypothetical protein